MCTWKVGPHSAFVLAWMVASRSSIRSFSALTCLSPKKPEAIGSCGCGAVQYLCGFAQRGGAWAQLAVLGLVVRWFTRCTAISKQAVEFEAESLDDEEEYEERMIEAGRWEAGYAGY